jgi:hypothetical protein
MIKNFNNFILENFNVIDSILSKEFNNKNIIEIKELVEYLKSNYVEQGEIVVFVIKLLLDDNNFKFYKSFTFKCQMTILNLINNLNNKIKTFNRFINIFEYKDLEKLYNDVWDILSLLDSEKIMLNEMTNKLRNQYKDLNFERKKYVLKLYDTILLDETREFNFNKKMKMYGDDINIYITWLEQITSDPKINIGMFNRLNVIYENGNEVLYNFNHYNDYEEYLKLSKGTFWCTHNKNTFKAYSMIYDGFYILFNLDLDPYDNFYKIFIEVVNAGSKLSLNKFIDFINVLDIHYDINEIKDKISKKTLKFIIDLKNKKFYE